ncbi:MAG TPA: rhomboid family intramembrane serine protease [bacterium]|nr:rhomboid family intramembrane serine protease [bacterium]
MERQSKGSMLCPGCRKLVSVSAERCPHCGAARPGLWGFGPAIARRFGGQLDPVRAITGVCVGFYVLALAVDLQSLFGGGGGGILGILSPTGRALRILGATAPVDLLAGRPWTILTAIYLHGGILHILFNVLWIRNLAPEVQRAFGPARFFLIWTFAGTLGFLASDFFPLIGIGRHSLSVGASGSIFGLLGALIVYGRTMGASMMTRQLWTWAILLGVMGFLLPGVDNFAHAGGFAGGWIAASLFRGGIGRPAGRVLPAVALGAGALTLLGFVFSVWTALVFFLSR